MYICTGLYISGFKFSYDSLEGFLRFKKKVLLHIWHLVGR